MKKKIKINLSIITFILSCASMMAIYALARIYPFGSKSLLTVDMSGQYVNFLAYFRDIFWGHSNIFYNFAMNLGSNAYGLFAYYMSSPLNIILCLFQEKHILEAILFLNVVKIGLAGTTMSIYLNKTTKLNRTSIIILSIMYALMSYNIAYSQNIMWLEGVLYLPLVILGIENIVTKQKYGTYITFLVLTIVSNFYMGYMVGIFSVIYFICKTIINSKGKTIKELLAENKNTIIIYIKAVIIILLISMIILLPVLLNLLNSKSEINTSSFELGTYYSPIDVISKIIIGSFNFEQLIFGPPNIFCGTLCLLMAVMYFINKKINEKEKIVYLFLIVFILLAFIVVPLNLVFHMLQTPVWFTFRYSYVFSFILIVLASKNMEKRKDGFEFSNLLKAQMIIILLILLLNKLNYSFITNINTLITILFILITGIVYYNSVNRGKIYKIGLILLVCIEMILNGYQIAKQMDYKDREEFVSSYHEMSGIINKYKSQTNDFYRIESIKDRTPNDSMLHDYNGLKHYSSTIGKGNKNFLTNFGMRHSFIPTNRGVTTLPMASILGIKYYIASSQNYIWNNMNWYNKQEENENTVILQNRYNLNLGFCVNDKVKETELKNNQPLENQNELFSKMTQIDEDLFEKVEIKQKNNINTIVNERNEELYLVYKIGEAPIKNIKIYFDEELTYADDIETNSNSNTVIYIPSNINNIKVEVDENDYGKIQLELYKFNLQTFEKMYNVLNKNQLEIEVNKNNYIKGKINVEEDSVLLNSIINDKGWMIKVDGKKVEKQTIAENLIGIDITKGEHTVEYSYTPTGFKLGLILTLCGIILLSLDQIRTRKIKNKK